MLMTKNFKKNCEAELEKKEQELKKRYAAMDPQRQDLAAEEWSCQSCSTLLDAVFKVLAKPLDKINEFIPLFFCRTNDEDCIKSYSGAINITGAIANLSIEKKSSRTICQESSECK